ncbi:MAG: DUF3102 domain-containing protein [gamma proteobacterium endosymbiont of Lamellibrachia anaximandri]|nr:DUF3102 domain-containing protein [gamma proteobacterium endosymbiont of Lamellibrachia anaximandri]
MARSKRTTKIEDPNESIDTQALEEATAKQDAENQRLAEIDATYGDGLPYERDRLIHEVQFYLQQSAEAMLEAGRRMVVLKEHEPHGDFTETLKEIGLVPRTARRMMQAAAKYNGNKAKLADLGKTKLLELMTEEDDDLEGLAEGGTLAGHTLDEIDRMSGRELRDALRAEKETREQDTEVHERLLESKDKKINELDKLVATGPVMPTWPELVEKMQVETQIATGRALEACDQLNALRDQILNGDMGDLQGEEAESAQEAMAVTYYDALAQLRAQTGQLWDDCDEVFSGYKMIADERAANISEAAQ